MQCSRIKCWSSHHCHLHSRIMAVRMHCSNIGSIICFQCPDSFISLSSWMWAWNTVTAARNQHLASSNLSQFPIYDGSGTPKVAWYYYNWSLNSRLLLVFICNAILKCRRLCPRLLAIQWNARDTRCNVYTFNESIKRTLNNLNAS